MSAARAAARRVSKSEACALLRAPTSRNAASPAPRATRYMTPDVMTLLETRPAERGCVSIARRANRGDAEGAEIRGGSFPFRRFLPGVSAFLRVLRVSAVLLLRSGPQAGREGELVVLHLVRGRVAL